MFNKGLAITLGIIGLVTICFMSWKHDIVGIACSAATLIVAGMVAKAWLRTIRENESERVNMQLIRLADESAGMTSAILGAIYPDLAIGKFSWCNGKDKKNLGFDLQVTDPQHKVKWSIIYQALGESKVKMLLRAGGGKAYIVDDPNQWPEYASRLLRRRLRV